MEDHMKQHTKTGEAEQFRKQVGGRLYQIRTALGLSQRDLAEKAELSQSAIAQFETGARLPSTSALQSLCGVLGIPMEKLLGGDASEEFDAGKELILERLLEKARTLSKDNIMTLNRMVEQLPSEKKEDK
jgi:transcriptional regulator with XRE-family HTH domain